MDDKGKTKGGGDGVDGDGGEWRDGELAARNGDLPSAVPWHEGTDCPAEDDEHDCTEGGNGDVPGDAVAWIAAVGGASEVAIASFQQRGGGEGKPYADQTE